ncbi:MAG: hypothetical protein KKD38_10280, partial [Candidatus Delongbacteria bacterium]|nr:hypothetical protein [Candidatus Delongbacteria bacterium]MCG2759951.1 hypothetical protein [Candidatus Delongbacteria bacterium]
MKLLPVTTEVKPYLQLYRVSDSYKLCTPETVPATIEAGIKYAGQKEGQAVSFPSVSINVEITNPNNSIVSTVVTNNTGGNVSIPFTGSAIGRYSITATINSSTYPEFSIYTQTFCVMIANDIDGDGDPDPDSSTDGDEDSEGELLVNLTIENDLTECMEGRELTFTAVISRDININKDDYYWSYVCTLPDGTEYTTSVGPVTDRTLTYDITMDNLLDGDTDHFYPAYSYVILESNTAKGIIESNKRNFKVFELFIKRIWDTEPNGIENDWKVVLGEDFWYEVIAPNNQSALEEMTWNWEFLQGATKKWSLESTMEDGNF